MILYNGKTGSLGTYLGGAASPATMPKVALRSRLEDVAGLRDELAALAPQLTSARGGLVFCHLAAKVSVPACEREPDAAWQTNVTDAVATVRAVASWAQELGHRFTVVYVSSGHVYAEQQPGTLIGEEHPLAPRSVYARTKLECEQRLAALADEMGHRLVIARLFGLIAPRQPPNYVLPGLIRRVLSAEVEGVPGLSFVRDYLDARDVCDCLLRLALSDREVPVVVNVCSGEPTSLRDLLVAIARCARPADSEALLARASEAPARPDDIRWIVGDPSLLVQVTGRAARRIPIVQTVADAVAVAGEAS